MARDHQPTVRIAIIGAGLAGMTVSSDMAKHTDVSIFEKSRGLGGRMSTRYSQHFQFDHGAQFFTARSQSFQRFLEPFIANGTVREWKPRIVTLGDGKGIYNREWFEPHYVASPRMTSLCNALTGTGRLHLNTRIMDIKYEHRLWFLRDQSNNRYGPFDWLIATIPAPQAAAILPEALAGYSTVTECRMSGCYSLMLGFHTALDLTWQAAVVKNSPIEWIAVDSAKPGRTLGYSLLAQTTRTWAEGHIDDEQILVQSTLLQELERLLPVPLTDPGVVQLHRWRYASAQPETERDYLIDHQLQLGVCGDWLIKGDVESAFLSARALTEQLRQGRLRRE